MGDHQNQDSPLKHTDLSPVYRDQSDSVYSLNPTSYFAASPVPKIVVTETMKIGSGRKSKENGLILSPDPSSSQNENYKKVVIMSPPKVNSTKYRSVNNLIRKDILFLQRKKISRKVLTD